MSDSRRHNEEGQATSTSAIVGRVAFRRGIEDFQTGAAPDFDGLDDDYYAYERGRQFAAACQGEGYSVPPNRLGRRVNYMAIFLFSQFGDDIL